MEIKKPLPPFSLESALEKVQLGEDAWNSQDPERISLTYTIDTEWRNRSEFIDGREEVVKFLTGKWQKELDYKLKKELWAFTENRIAVRFDDYGLMRKRYACINDLAIKETDRHL
jgi:nuclear transport factor 2 (NTF2) superfamily protein